MILRNIELKDKHKWMSLGITVLGSILYAIGISVFIIPAGLYTGGFTGIAQLLSDLSAYLFNRRLSVSLVWVLLNIPIFVIGFKYVGKRFTTLSVVSVIVGSIVLEFFPHVQLSSGTEVDKLLYAIMGGVITGIGVGITLKVGSSTGGMDIVSQFLSQKNDRPIGQYSFILNGVIVLIAGATNVWDIAFYTIINLFISSLVIDKIHTRHNKLTLMIVTEEQDKLVKAIQEQVYRGITILPAYGAYSKQEKTVLLMVVTSYELFHIKTIIESVDPHAFTDVIKSQTVFGNFHRPKVE